MRLFGYRSGMTGEPSHLPPGSDGGERDAAIDCVRLKGLQRLITGISAFSLASFAA